jgi:hypothetical protein
MYNLPNMGLVTVILMLIFVGCSGGSSVRDDDSIGAAEQAHQAELDSVPPETPQLSSTGFEDEWLTCEKCGDCGLVRVDACKDAAVNRAFLKQAESLVGQAPIPSIPCPDGARAKCTNGKCTVSYEPECCRCTCDTTCDGKPGDPYTGEHDDCCADNIASLCQWILKETCATSSCECTCEGIIESAHCSG